MYQPPSRLALAATRTFIEASNDEWVHYFITLRRNKQLSTVVAEINKMLEHPEYRQLAIDAFRRIGLWDGSSGKDA